MPSSAGKKKDGSGDTVEFASGSFLVVPGGSTGGVLLVSGANVRSEERRVGKECSSGGAPLKLKKNRTGGKMTLDGGSIGCSGALTVIGSNWTGGTWGGVR